MPTYAYRCDACGLARDEWLKISEAAAERTCPSCGQPSYRKQVTAPAFQLKGSGWYVTDFRDNGKKPAAESAAKSDATKPDAGKAETAKPDSGAAAATDAGTSASSSTPSSSNSATGNSAPAPTGT